MPTAEVTAWSPPKMLVQWESGGDAGGEMGRVKMTPETYVSFTNLQNRFFYAILIIIWHFIKSSTINELHIDSIFFRYTSKCIML